MKTKLLLFLLCIATMTFAGCKPDPATKPQDQVPIVDLKLSEVSLMASSIKFKVEPSDKNQAYLCVCVNKAVAEGKEDKLLITTLMADLKKQADEKSMELGAYIASIAHKGDKEIAVENLAPNTEYTIVAWCVNGVTTGAETDRHTFKTLAADRSDCTFIVDVVVTGNAAKYSIKPSDKEIDWYFCTMQKEKYDGVSTEGNLNQSQMLIEYFAYETAVLEQAGMTQEQILEQLLHKGDVSLSAKGLDAEKEYVYLAGAIARTSTGLVLVSDVLKGAYTTGKAPLSDMTFKITVDNIRKTHVHLKIEPTKIEEKYLMLCSNYNPDNKDMTPDQMMESYYKGLGVWAGMSSVSGVTDIADYRVAAGLDYFVLAFGFAGGPTTAPEIVKFSVPAGQNPADATIAAKVDSKNPFGATLTFTPSDETVYYSFGLQETGTIEKDSIIKYFEKGLVENLKMQHSMFGVLNMTMADVIMSGYFHEVTPFTFDGDLKPNTTYDLFTATISMDGKVAAFKEHSAFLTTPNMSATTATTTVRGYFNGDQEAGQVFGQPEVTAGQSIIAFQYTPSGADIAKIYSAITIDNPEIDELDPNVVSDKDLRSQLKWTEHKATAPYEFVLAAWDKDLYSFVYTATADGGYGNITRTAVAAPKKDKVGTIDQLKTIYDEAQEAGKSKVVKSVAMVTPSAKPAIAPFAMCKKESSSFLNRYAPYANADKSPVKVTVPYSLGASINLPLARVAK